mgnify:CR=1 FL=1|jgi:hypothetical protein
MIKWLYKNVSDHSKSTNKELSDTLFVELITMINEHDELNLEDDLETFKIKFYNFIYTTIK